MIHTMKTTLMSGRQVMALHPSPFHRAQSLWSVVTNTELQDFTLERPKRSCNLVCERLLMEFASASAGGI